MVADGTPSHFIFSCGPQSYAVRAEQAHEVVTFPALTRVPGAPMHVLGVFNHRGEVIPVIDLGSLGARHAESSQRAVILRAEGGPYALTVTKVVGVSRIEGEGSTLGDSGFLAHLRGPVKSESQYVLLLDVDGLFEFLRSAGHPNPKPA